MNGKSLSESGLEEQAALESGQVEPSLQLNPAALRLKEMLSSRPFYQKKVAKQGEQFWNKLSGSYFNLK